MSTLLQTLTDLSPLLPWVLASVAWYALAANGLWLLVHRSGRKARWRRGLHSVPGQLALWWARILWLIGPGYAALLLGMLSPWLMGLSQVELGWSLGQGALFAAAALGVLLAAGLNHRRAAQEAASPYYTFSHGVAITLMLVIEGGALQWQWAFYRSAVIEALTTAGWDAPLYWGVWLAAALICVQGALSPWLWRDLRIPGQAERRVLRATLLLATSVLYLLSRSFWLAWALHSTAIVILEPRVTQSEPASGNKKAAGGLAAAGSPCSPTDDASEPD